MFYPERFETLVKDQKLTPKKSTSDGSGWYNVGCNGWYSGGKVGGRWINDSAKSGSDGAEGTVGSDSAGSQKERDNSLGLVTLMSEEVAHLGRKPHSVFGHTGRTRGYLHAEIEG